MDVDLAWYPSDWRLEGNGMFCYLVRWGQTSKKKNSTTLSGATDLYPAFLSMSTEEKNEIVPDDPTQAGEKRFFCILGSVIVGFIHFHTKSQTKVFGQLTCI